jgi:hypothetical protein
MIIFDTGCLAWLRRQTAFSCSLLARGLSTYIFSDQDSNCRISVLVEDGSERRGLVSDLPMVD